MTTATSAKRNSMLLMALCAIMWSLGGIFIKLISWNPLLICGVRSVIAALILGGYMFITRTPVNFNKYSFGAGIGLSTSCIFFVFANKLTTAANAIVLQYTAPIFILLMSAFLFHSNEWHPVRSLHGFYRRRSYRAYDDYFHHGNGNPVRCHPGCVPAGDPVCTLHGGFSQLSTAGLLPYRYAGTFI